MRLLKLISSIIVLACLVTCGKQETPEHKTQAALENLLHDSKRMSELYANIQKDFQVSIVVGDLKGQTEGQTAISHQGATITIDVQEVIQKRDRLEPVIAHELFHINDARFVYGIDRFIAIVDAEKDRDWWDRTVEQSAVKQEDQLRFELLGTGRYNGMSPTRAVQNWRNKI